MRLVTKFTFILIIYHLFLINYCLTNDEHYHVQSNTSFITPNDWFDRLLVNLFGYAIILVPAGLLVYMVRHNLCFPKVSNNYLVKWFVYGTESDTSLIHGHDDDQHLLLPVTTSDTREINHKTSPLLPPRFRKASLLMYCFFGLQLSYLTWGVLQEKIMTTQYQVHLSYFDDQVVNRVNIPDSIVEVFESKIDISGDKNIASNQHDLPQLASYQHIYHIKFRNSQFLVLVNRILAFMFALIAILILKRDKSHASKSPKAPLHEFIYCSLSNILSSWCQYEALKFVSFPTQVLSKACKLIPVMLMGQLINGKSYRTMEYIFAVAISFGMTLFLLSDHESNKKQHAMTNSITEYNYVGGLIILALYLTFDSFTSNWQGKLFDKYKVSTWQMMGAINMCSILLTCTSLTQQGDLTPAFKLVLSNSILFRDCILLSLCSAAGQLFVFYTIATFGPLVFVTIMTLRQVLAILLSCLIYSHAISVTGIIGILLVFITLFAQIYWKSSSRGK